MTRDATSLGVVDLEGGLRSDLGFLDVEEAFWFVRNDSFSSNAAKKRKEKEKKGKKITHLT